MWVKDSEQAAQTGKLGHYMISVHSRQKWGSSSDAQLFLVKRPDRKAFSGLWVMSNAPLTRLQWTQGAVGL